jgi:plastocyanin
MSTNQLRRQFGINRKLLALGIALLIFAVPIGLQSAAAEPKVHTITIKDFKFLPATITVNVGDTIVWKNEDLAPHTATSKGKNAFDSGNLDSGASWSYVVKKKGTYSYYCAYHLNMKGKLVVR